MRFEYRGNRRYPISASTVSAELTRIWEDHGEQLTPADVVEEARPEAAPLHPIFEWRDEIAAEAHRRWQARCLIRDVRVVHDEGFRTPKFVHVRVEEPYRRRNFYQNIDVLPERATEYAAALREARKLLTSAITSFVELDRLNPKSEQPDPEAVKINVILESLGTARAVAETLQ